MYGINAASVSGYASGKISCSQQRYEYCKAIYEGNYTAITEPFIVNLILGKNIEEIKETLDSLGYELIIEVRKKV